jgi:CubicO group peptidase (beta-lactamase class C family)
MPYSEAARERRWHSGGGGMVSTASDYLRFCQMLLNGGELDAVRLLSPKTVAHMTSDHLPPDVAYGPSARDLRGTGAPLPELGQGFGLGFAVRKAVGMSPLPGSVGDYFWGGIYGTSFWVDPAEQMIVVLMLQAPEQRTYYRQLIRHLVYATLTRARRRGYR